jgi:hypothetical protein
MANEASTQRPPYPVTLVSEVLDHEAKPQRAFSSENPQSQVQEAKRKIIEVFIGVYVSYERVLLLYYVLETTDVDSAIKF